jgi:hypothetical protein
MRQVALVIKWLFVCLNVNEIWNRRDGRMTGGWRNERNGKRILENGRKEMRVLKSMRCFPLVQASVNGSLSQLNKLIKWSSFELSRT